MSYKVPTVDRGYHVTMAVWEAVVGLILPCNREGFNIYHSFAVENIDTPIVDDAAVLHENFRN